MPKPYVPYCPEVAERILFGLALGKGLRAICRGPRMPTRPTVMRWLRERPDFAHSAAEARRHGGLAAPGRPSLASRPLVDRIYLRLCHGEPLRTLCRDPALPSRSTVQSWARRRADVAHALELGRQIARETRVEARMEALGGWAYFGPPPAPPEESDPAPPPGPRRS
jgi:hypothetical protein